MQGNRINVKLTSSTASYWPYRGSFISLFSFPRTAPLLRSGLSWAIFDSSLRDEGAAQFDEAEKTNSLRQQVTFMRLPCDVMPAHCTPAKIVL
jgi:hypothetical protein